MANITRNHPVREVFAGCSTTGKCVGYYDTKGHAVRSFDNALRGYGFRLAEDECIDFTGDSGCRGVNVMDGCDQFVGLAQLSWYRMPSGRYEFTGYLT